MEWVDKRLSRNQKKPKTAECFVYDQLIINFLQPALAERHRYINNENK
jgi:hypothetical protein